MDNKTRWSVNFDLKQNKLSKYYKPNFRDAWNKVWKVMKRYGFKHDQHSGYVTDNSMTRISVYKLLDNVIKELPWLIKSIDVCKLTRFAGDEDIVKHYEREKELEELI